MAWLTAREAAAAVGRHIATVRLALEDGRLHGHQRARGGNWTVAPAALDAWLHGINGRTRCPCHRKVL